LPFFPKAEKQTAAFGTETPASVYAKLNISMHTFENCRFREELRTLKRPDDDDDDDDDDDNDDGDDLYSVRRVERVLRAGGDNL